MDELRRVYRQALRARIDALESARAALGNGASGPAAAAAASVRRAAHALRGSGGTYGFPEVSTAAAAVEDASDSKLPRRLDDLLELLRATIAADDG